MPGEETQSILKTENPRKFFLLTLLSAPVILAILVPSFPEADAQYAIANSLVEPITDANSSTGSTAQTEEVPSDYAHVFGVVDTYPYSDGKRFMMEGIRVELWEPGATSPFRTVYTVHGEHDPDDILAPRNYVQGGVWNHVDNSGLFDFGNVFVGNSKQFILRVVFIFYDGADGVSENGVYKLSIVDTSKANAPLIYVEYPAMTFHSGQDGCPGLCAYHIPALGSDGPQDEAGHAYYDVVKTYTYFQQAASYSISLKTVRLNVESPGVIGGGYEGITLSYWPEAPGYLTFEKSGNIIHEYGHTIQADMQGYDFPLLQGYPVQNSFHRGCTNMDSEDAMREGWANFVAIVVLDDPVFYWEDYYSGMDLRPGQHPRNAQCDRDGATVASVLWNMRENMGPDRHENLKKIAQTLATNNPIYVRTFFDDYIRDWGQEELIHEIFKSHNVDYNLTEHPVNILIDAPYDRESYRPKTIQVNAGHTVIWNNTDSVVHTVTSGYGPSPDGKFGLDSSGGPILILPKETFQFTFNQAGNYPYFCQLHPAMTGTVIVESVAAADEPEPAPVPGAPADPLRILAGSSIQGNEYYAPDPYVVPAGQHQVTVFNEDQVLHTVTSGLGANDPLAGSLFDTSMILPGESATIDLGWPDRFPPGDYPYFCLVHPYMTGTMRLEAAPVNGNNGNGDDNDNVVELPDEITSPPADVPTLSITQSGQSVTLSVALTYTGTESPFAAVVEVRDSNEFTQYLTWLTGTLRPDDAMSVNTLWTPSSPGEYTFRAFFVSSVESPIVALTQVAQTLFTVDSDTVQS